jgi:hypothetical protein
MNKVVRQYNSFGTQTSPTVGVPLGLSNLEVVTLCKVGSEIESPLKFNLGSPSLGSMTHFHPNLNSCDEPIMLFKKQSPQLAL